MPAPLPAPTKYTPSGTIPNTPFWASAISWGLGGLFWACLTAAVLLQPGPAALVRPQLLLYLAAWALFHSLEFWTTAACNTERLSVDAFLLNNGTQYHVAHIIGLLEYFITCYLTNDGPSAAMAGSSGLASSVWAFRKWWMDYGSLVIALPLLIAAQALRALAMIHAAGSFSHVVSRSSSKQDGHVLVTSGVYRISRHPAYTGFFYWALSTQLLLGNTISFIGFWLVLTRFFKWRIIDEEIHLVRYFGDAYLRFRERTGHWLPVSTTYVPPSSSSSSAAAAAAKMKITSPRTTMNGGSGGPIGRKDQ